MLGVAENAGAGITTDITGQFTGFNISLDVPYNTNLSALVPTISITGVSVSPASGAVQAFTDGVAVTYTVTAADASAQDYEVTVNLLPSTDATLSSLTVSSGSLTPAFAPGTYSYTVDVANTVTSIDIAAAAADSGAAVTGDIGTVGLNVGVNNFTVTCTAEDGTTVLNYTLAITRSATPSDGTITVELTGAAANNGDPAGFAVFTDGSDYIPGNELASNGGTISGGLFSAVAEDSGIPFTFTGGTIYTIYFMIDVNGNDIPDAGDLLGDMETPIVNGNITASFDYTDLYPYEP